MRCNTTTTFLPVVKGRDLCRWRHSPLPGVHVQAVEVAGQAVLVGTEGLVAAVDVDGPGAGVEDAAVAVAALHQSAGGGRQVPRALGCGETWGGGKRGVVRWSPQRVDTVEPLISCGGAIN